MIVHRVDFLTRGPFQIASGYQRMPFHRAPLRAPVLVQRYSFRIVFLAGVPLLLLLCAQLHFGSLREGRARDYIFLGPKVVRNKSVS